MMYAWIGWTIIVLGSVFLGAITIGYMIFDRGLSGDRTVNGNAWLILIACTIAFGYAVTHTP